MNFGEKLYSLRKKNFYSQGVLAEKLGVTRQAVSKWELNEMLPDYENIIKIAKLFSVSTDYLLKNDVEMKIQYKRIMPVFSNKFDNVDFIAAVTVLWASITAFVYYVLRLFFTFTNHNYDLIPRRDNVNHIYWDSVWFYAIDEIVILSVLAIVIFVVLIIVNKLNKTHK